MPSSPFGLSYGLGAGLASVPQAYTQGQQQGIALSMQQMQAAEMQRQMQQTQAINQQLATPVETPMVKQAVMGENPEYQSQLAAQNEYNKRMTEQAQEAASAGAPAFGLGQETAPEVTAPQQIKTGEKEVEKQWSTPYEKMAYEAGVRADRLAQMGMGLASNQFRQIAQQYQGQHMEMLGQLGAKYVTMGSEKAIPILQELGYPGAQKIVSLDDAQKTKAVVMENGDVVPLSPGALAAMAAGGNIANFLNQQQHWNMTYEGQLANASSRRFAAEEAGRSARYRADVGLQGVLARAGATVSAAQVRANAPDAQTKFFNTLSAGIQAENPNWTGDQVRAAVLSSGLWSRYKDDANGAASQVRQIAQSRMKFLEGKYNGKEPPVGSADRADYDQWKAEIGQVVQTMKPKLSRKTPPTPAAGAPNVGDVKQFRNKTTGQVEDFKWDGQAWIKK